MSNDELVIYITNSLWDMTQTYQREKGGWTQTGRNSVVRPMTAEQMLSNKVLLICGILSSLLYVVTDSLAGMLWEGYSFAHQAVSELSAIGAPTRPLVVPLYIAYDVLMIAFGLGVWGYSRKRALRFAGGLLVGIGAVGVVGVPFPLHLGIAEATFTNTMHSAIAGVTVLLFLLAIGFGAFAWGKRFRLYSVGTLLATIVLGTVSGFMAGAQITAQGFTTPPQWFGAIERITIYCSMLWVVVLAIVLLRAEKGSRSMRTQTYQGESE